MEAKLKHLEFIQAVIARMATNSFLFKGWAITLAAALSAFGAVYTRAALLVIAFVTTILFWGLDGYYLWLERRFRDLHNQVAAKDQGDIDFLMAFDRSRPIRGWIRACFRPHLLVFYLAILAVDLVGVILVQSK